MASTPVFLIAAPALAGAGPGDAVHLDGEEARHAVSVRRLRAGEQVDLVDGVGTRVRGTVAGVQAQPPVLSVQVNGRTDEVRPHPDLGLVQALAKGGRDELAVETSTEVGVAEIIPWQAARSVSQWRGPKVAKGRQRWQQIATAAAKQARRAYLPQIGELLVGAHLMPWVRSAVGRGETVLVLHENASIGIDEARVGGAARVIVVVGPEGGLSQTEVRDLTTAGAQPVRLGPHVLRTSTAGPIALALLAQRLGHWCAVR